VLVAFLEFGEGEVSFVMSFLLDELVLVLA
jgi:hypothetical protein